MNGDIDEYKMLEEPSEGEYKEKGSKFLSYAYPLDNLNNVEVYLLELKKLHPKSRHICFAYRVGFDGNMFRTNDDGEPSGTAGRPIMGVIDSFELSNTLIAVVRYFGGTKLGASGLIQAYKTAAHEAIVNGKIIGKVRGVELTIDFDYAHMGVVMDAVKNLGIEIKNLTTDTKPFLIIVVPRSQVKFYMKSIKAGLLNRSLDDIDDDTNIDYLSFTKA